MLTDLPPAHLQSVAADLRASAWHGIQLGVKTESATAAACIILAAGLGRGRARRACG